MSSRRLKDILGSLCTLTISWKVSVVVWRSVSATFPVGQAVQFRVFPWYACQPHGEWKYHGQSVRVYLSTSLQKYGCGDLKKAPKITTYCKKFHGGRCWAGGLNPTKFLSHHFTDVYRQIYNTGCVVPFIAFSNETTSVKDWNKALQILCYLTKNEGLV